jgi:DNA repair exonuclease SbcCD ATPase subunit
MEVELDLENVGGLRGKSKFKFEKGAVTLAEGSNTAGKSSLVKGLVSVLSVPSDGEFSDFAQKEARALGVRTEEKSAREGFVNVHEDVANVELTIDDLISRYSVTREGKMKALPQNGNEGFLMAGILSKDCKVMRQLQEGSDDFAWAVTMLSLAKYYDSIKETILTRREDAAERTHLIGEKIRRLSKISEDKEKLERDLGKITKEVESLKGRADKIRVLLEKRQKESDAKIKLQVSMGNLDGVIAKARRELAESTRESEKYSSKIEELREKIEAIEKKTASTKTKERIEEIEKEVAALIDERSRLEGILNLFVTAQSNLKDQKGDGTCPLCENGRVSDKQIEKRLLSLRQKKEEMNGRIVKLNREKNDLTTLATRVDHEIEQLNKQIKDVTFEKKSADTTSTRVKSALTGNEDVLKEKEREMKKHNEEIEKLSKISPGEDQKTMDEFDKKDKLREEISYSLKKIAEELADSAEIVGGKTLSVHAAKNVLDKYAQTLDNMIQYSEGKAREHRETARTRFNENVNGLMGDLKFKEFRTVKLNEDYRLYVERKKGSSNDYVLQQVKTLSGSEKMAIAMILQLALKETYLPGTPFFVLDDVIVEFDDDRKKTVLDYLRRIAKEKQWCIVATNLDETRKSLSLRTLRG